MVDARCVGSSCQHNADEDADRREQLDKKAVERRRAACRLLLSREGWGSYPKPNVTQPYPKPER